MKLIVSTVAVLYLPSVPSRQAPVASTSRRAVLGRTQVVLWGVCVVALATACRARERFSWTENNGQVSGLHIAATSAGVYVIRNNNQLDRYSHAQWVHDRGRPWGLVPAGDQLYLLDGAELRQRDGTLVKTFRPTERRGLQVAAWGSTVYYANDSHGVKRLRHGKVTDTACIGLRSPRSLAGTKRGVVYVVSSSGMLSMGRARRCAPFEPAPPLPVRFVAAHYDRLGIVDREGNAWLLIDSQWVDVPLPIIHRVTRRPKRSDGVRELALSKHGSWALTVEGTVHTLHDSE